MPPAPNPLPPVPGYELLAELGRGGMGVVYQARHLKLDRLVAVKMPLGGASAKPKHLARFMVEARAMAALQHANIAQVFDYGDSDGQPYLVMEFLEGGSLADRLERRGSLPAGVAAPLVEALGRAVGVGHGKGIIHRDLKPGNVLFDAEGRPKVTDFGMAKLAGFNLTSTTASLGTPHYMAPEQFDDSREAGPPADVWALGIILYECLTGRRPFVGHQPIQIMYSVLHHTVRPVRELAPEVPSGLEEICLRCLRRDATDRPRDATELADLLRQFRRAESSRTASAESEYKRGLARSKGVTAADLTAAVGHFRNAAGAGHAEAQFRLAQAARDGRGIPVDLAYAAQWLERAAEQGHPEAAVELAWVHREGRGVPKDPAKAVSLFRRAADSGHPEAQFQLARAYQTGQGVAADPRRAARWLERAAAQEHPAAQYQLGLAYEAGAGVDRDPAAAREWLGRSAAQGFTMAEIRVGLSDLDLSRTERGAVYAADFAPPAGRSDPDTAVLEPDSGSTAPAPSAADAAFRTGLAYWNDEACAKDADIAVSCFQDAAAGGHVEAQYLLGQAFHRGWGVDPSAADSMHWFERAATGGHPAAQFALAEAIRHRASEPEAHALAAEWYCRSAAGGHREAAGWIERNGAYILNHLARPRR